MQISSGEGLEWVQKMLGYPSLKMITDEYFSYIPNKSHQDSSKFFEKYERQNKNITTLIICDYSVIKISSPRDVNETPCADSVLIIIVSIMGVFTKFLDSH